MNFESVSKSIVLQVPTMYMHIYAKTAFTCSCAHGTLLHASMYMAHLAASMACINWFVNNLPLVVSMDPPAA